MKKTKILLMMVFLLVNKVQANDSSLKLPLVFDPQTKKYFIGGGSKLALKPNQQSGYIDRIEMAIDNDEYKPYNQSIEFTTEGKHTLKFRALNPVNTWSPVQFVEVFVDLTAPSTEVKFSDEWSFKDVTGLYLGTKSTLSLSAQDNLSGVATIEYSNDGKNFLPYSKPITFENNGPQSIYYRSVDRVGNAEAVKKIDFFADAAVPQTELKLGGKSTVIKGQNYISDGLPFELISKDEGSKVKQTWVSIDGQKPELYIKPIFFLAEGPHSIKYYSVDNVGNKETEKSFSFYTISAPGYTSVQPIGKTINMGGLNYVNPDFQLKLEAKENVVGIDRIEYSQNGGEFKPYFEPLRFSPGQHVVTYRSVDRVGNIEPAKTYTLSVVDGKLETQLNTAQPLIIRDGVTYSPAPNVITLNVAGQLGVGVAETLYSINDGPMVPYKGPITISSDSRDYKITYKSIDKLGNEEPVKTTSFQLIRSTPIVDLFISNGMSPEEQVRTQYLDHHPSDVAGAVTKPANDKSNIRNPASNTNKDKKK